MPSFLYNFFKDIKSLYKGRNLLWQAVFIVLTYILVQIGFDWFYYQSTGSEKIQSLLFPAVILGFFVPIFLPLGLLLHSFFIKNLRIRNTAYAIMQSAFLGLGISSLYKVFTGRVGLPHFITNIDTSQIFQFGFYRGGAFQGWPSSHTSVAFAVSMALFTLYPENKLIRYSSIAYAVYVGLGVSATIHWFSDFMAGAILGTIIGITVGKSFLERYNFKKQS
jgi:membrane-associated phospholipid phosphatase